MSRWSLPDPSTRVVALPDPADAAPAPARKVETLGAWLLVTGGGLVMLGSILPWSVVTSFKKVLSEGGVEGDGRITLVLGLVIAVAGLVALTRRTPLGVPVVALVSAVIATVVAGYSAFDLGALGDGSDQLASLEVGHGLVITVIGGVVAIVGGARLVARA